MPLSRKKSCVACIRSKLRCDRKLPTCSRCAHKNLQCLYDSQRPVPYPEVASSTQGVLGQPALSLSRSIQTRIAGLRNVRHESDFGPQQVSTAANSAACLNYGEDAIFCQSNIPGLGSMSDMTDILGAGDKAGLLPTMEGRRSPDYRNFLDTSFFEPDYDPDVALATSGKSTVGPVEASPDLSALSRRPFAQGTVLSSVILGQLTSYPKMMIEGDKLPPFISPPCHTTTVTWLLNVVRRDPTSVSLRSWQCARVSCKASIRGRRRTKISSGDRSMRSTRGSKRRFVFRCPFKCKGVKMLNSRSTTSMIEHGVWGLCSR
jgi:hypothetical protein